LNKFEIIQIQFDRLGPTCHTLLSPFLSLISGAYTGDGPTCRPPCSHFSLPRTEPLSPLRSPARDMCAARPTPPLPSCPTTPSLAQPHPALKPPPLHRPFFLTPPHLATAPPIPPLQRRRRHVQPPTRAPNASSSRCRRILSAEQGSRAAPSTPHSPERLEATARDRCRHAGSTPRRPI
jgi:hypothetical protein